MHRKFGSGLSYTSFSLALAEKPATSTTYEVTVENTGAVAGANVVLLFSTVTCAEPLAPGELVPLKSLVDFGRTLVLEPGASEVIEFVLDVRQLALVSSAGATVLCKGSYALSFSDGSTSNNATYVVAETAVVRTIPQPPSPVAGLGRVAVPTGPAAAAVAPAVAPQLAVLAALQNCSLNGDLVGGKCKCDAAWSGSAVRSARRPRAARATSSLALLAVR